MNVSHLGLIILTVALAAMLGGCYQGDEVNAFLLQPRTPISGTDYCVLPPDILQVTSRNIPEINGLTQQIRPDGKVNLPLVGEMDCAGKTCRQIEEQIVKAASEYYNQTDATVTVVAYNSQKYFVFGEVTRPGPEPWTGHDTLLDALARAQPTFLAWHERVIVVRGDQPQEGGRQVLDPEAGKRSGVQPEDPLNPRHTLTINLKAMVRSGDMTNNILLKPNDVIYVQPNPLAKVGLALQSLLFPVRPAIEATQAPGQLQNLP